MIGRTNAGMSGTKYSIKNWCATVGLSYNTLSEITEADMRTLMTKYASVAYFLEWYNAHNDMIDAFIEDEKAMKWIGHRDYICDKLLAITDFKTKALASEYWEYILKDHVPIMTSDSAPYGSVVSEATTYSSYYLWHAFDGNSTSEAFSTSKLASGSYIGYKFTNPVAVKKIKGTMGSASNGNTTTVVFDYFDGTNWIEITNSERTYTGNGVSAFSDVSCNTPYCFGIRMRKTGGTATYLVTSRLQFYGRSLNVSVPTMTSDTSPYGEIFASGEYDSNRSKLKAFDGAVQSSSSMGWLPSPSDTWGNAWIDYLFTSEISLKQVYVSLWNGSGGGTTLRNIQFKMVGVNGDGSTEDISSALNIEYSGIGYYFAISNIKAFKQIRFLLVGTSGSASPTSGSGYKLQFYGVDYSERTDRTYLYDHGVELVPISAYGRVDGKHEENKLSDRLKISINETSTTATYPLSMFHTDNKIDLSSYNHLFVLAPNGYKSRGGYFYSAIRNNSATDDTASTATSKVEVNNLPLVHLDISSVNDSEYVQIYSTVSYAVNGAEITEWWLE